MILQINKTKQSKIFNSTSYCYSMEYLQSYKIFLMDNPRVVLTQPPEADTNTVLSLLRRRYLNTVPGHKCYLNMAPDGKERTM